MPVSTLPQPALSTGVAGTGPAFSAVLSGNQTIAFNVFTKLIFNTEIFDTNSCYDSTTNYRFTPNVAGYYQVNLQVLAEGTPTRNYIFYSNVYKNGSSYPNSTAAFSLVVGAGSDNSIATSLIIYMNGTTDFLEAYGYQVDYTASSTMNVKSAGTNFSAVLVRAA